MGGYIYRFRPPTWKSVVFASYIPLYRFALKLHELTNDISTTLITCHNQQQQGNIMASQTPKDTTLSDDEQKLLKKVENTFLKRDESTIHDTNFDFEPRQLSESEQKIFLEWFRAANPPRTRRAEQEKSVDSEVKPAQGYETSAQSKARSKPACVNKSKAQSSRPDPKRTQVAVTVLDPVSEPEVSPEVSLWDQAKITGHDEVEKQLTRAVQWYNALTFLSYDFMHIFVSRELIKRSHALRGLPGPDFTDGTWDDTIYLPPLSPRGEPGGLSVAARTIRLMWRFRLLALYDELKALEDKLQALKDMKSAGLREAEIKNQEVDRQLAEPRCEWLVWADRGDQALRRLREDDHPAQYEHAEIEMEHLYDELEMEEGEL